MTEISLFFSHNQLIHDRDFLFLVKLLFRFSTHHNIIRLCSPQVHLTSECVVDEARRSQGNHGYQTRAAMEETSRQSAEAADDDESISEVDVIKIRLPRFAKWLTLLEARKHKKILSSETSFCCIQMILSFHDFQFLIFAILVSSSKLLALVCLLVQFYSC